MITAENVIAAAVSATPVPGSCCQKAIKLEPPVALISTRTNETVHAQLVYGLDGKYKNCVHLVERINWWPLAEFELATNSQ